MNTSAQRPVKILFLAWGYSIHAKRRIQIFVDDPAFSVTVASTHAYDFAGAENILLRSKSSLLSRGLGAVRTLALGILPFRLVEDSWRTLIDVVQLLSIVKRINPDVVFAQTLIYPGYLALLLPKTIPLMVTFWNGDVTWWAKWDGVERLLKKQIVTKGVLRAGAITVNSQTAFDACLGYGSDSEKIHLIRYPGVDMERFYPGDKGRARQKTGFVSEHVVFSPRGLGGYLNSDVILRAAALVVREMPGVTFAMSCALASPAQLEEHKKQARELGIEASCHWVHGVDWVDMPDYYNAASVMVSISSKDSLPNCMLEAMACRVPVIVGDIPQLAEWVTDGVTGFLVPPRDHVLLAERLLALLQNCEQIADVVTGNAFGLIGNTVDSRKTIPMIKQLVLDTVGEKLP